MSQTIQEKYKLITRYVKPKQGHNMRSKLFQFWHNEYRKPGATFVYEQEFRKFVDMGYLNPDKSSRFRTHMFELINNSQS